MDGTTLPSTRVGLLAVGTIYLASGVAKAGEQSRPLESARAFARGGTYVAAYDSDEASRGNPATLAEANVKFQLRWLQLDMFVGSNTVQTISDVADIATGTGDTGLVGLLDKFEDKFGERQYARVQVSPLALRILSFEIMPFMSSSNLIDVRVPTLPVAAIASDTRFGATIAYATRLGKDMSIGLSMRPENRTTYMGDMGFSDVASFIDNSDLSLTDVIQKREGFQIGFNAGWIWQASKTWRLGATVENIGYAGNYSEFKDPPSPQPMRVSLGSAYRVDWKPWYWDFTVDLQDIVNPEGYHPLRLLHVGSEIGRTYVSRDTDVGFLLGLNEGWGTMGAYADIFLARLTASYYAVELGEYPGQRKDRRYGITAAISTTF